MDYHQLLAVLPNCNAETRCKNWPGALLGNTRIGCGINVLYFMGQIDNVNTLNGLKLAAESGEGTPFSSIVKWFNWKNPNKANVNYIEQQHPINTVETLKTFYDYLYMIMPNNTCCLAKLNRNIHTARAVNLTPGHYVLVSKESNGQLFTYEPIYSTREKCNKREYKGSVSPNFFKAYSDQHYISCSVLFI